MNRKDHRAHKFGHWSPNRKLYQDYPLGLSMNAEIDEAFWQNIEKDISRYLLWEFTH